MTRLPAAPTARQDPSARRRVLLILLAAGALALVASSAELHEWLIGFLPVAESMVRARPVLGVTVFILYAAVSAMLAFVSAAVIVPVGIYVWGTATSMLLLWLGWTLGGVAAYTLSRYFGRLVVTALHLGPVLERYEHRISQRASFGLVLLFQLAMPSEVPGYLLGLLRYPFWWYLAALLLAELPYAAATVYLGASFIERRTYMLLGVGAAVAALSGWALYTLHRRVPGLGTSKPAGPSGAPSS
jgi:uncharacterized membrane protein YdjX (TVP38/TMEM64 family)